jgi:Tol biopolymer transport system component
VLIQGTEFNEDLPNFSPDGRWVAYLSNESGRFELYVRPFVSTGPAFGAGKWQVSRSGAAMAEPRWRKDGRELFFSSADNQLMSVVVNGTGSALEVGIPHALFSHNSLGPVTGNGWDVTPDGRKFLMRNLAAQDGQTPITVIVNWQAGLER